MTSAGVIARRLETVFVLPAGTPAEIEIVLDVLDRTEGRSR